MKWVKRIVISFICLVGASLSIYMIHSHKR